MKINGNTMLVTTIATRNWSSLEPLLAPLTPILIMKANRIRNDSAAPTTYIMTKSPPFIRCPRPLQYLSVLVFSLRTGKLGSEGERAIRRLIIAWSFLVSCGLRNSFEPTGWASV